MRFRWLVLLALLTAPAAGQVVKDQRAPDFTLLDLDGENFSLSEHLGKGPILINFWATWCTPCLEEMKALIPVYEKFNGKGLEILSIAVDDPKTVTRVKSYVHSRKYPFKILLDTNNEVMQMYQTSVPPFSVLLRGDGTIAYTHTGYRKGDEVELESRIQALLPAGNP